VAGRLQLTALQSESESSARALREHRGELPAATSRWRRTPAQLSSLRIASTKRLRTGPWGAYR
jgi:hypothetical protein